MVKLEDSMGCDSSSNGEAGGFNSSTCAGSSVLNPCFMPVGVKEESLSSSSSSHYKSYLVGMGFSPILVDKVIEQNGEEDVNVLVEALLTQSVYLKPSSASASLSAYPIILKEEESSPFEFTPDDDNQDKELIFYNSQLPSAVKELNRNTISCAGMEKRSYLLMMEFSDEEIDSAIARLGENSSLGELVDFIIAAQKAQFCGDDEMLGSVAGCIENEAYTAEALFGTMDKTLCLFRMGFTENEVSSAIAKFGSDAPLNKLADSIFASRLAFEVKEEDFSNDDIFFSPQEENEFEQLGCAKGEHPKVSFPPAETWLKNTSRLNCSFNENDDNRTLKKAKFAHENDADTFCQKTQWKNAGQFKCPSTQPGASTEYPDIYGSIDTGFLKQEFSEYKQRNLSQTMEFKSPYFFYGNVADVSHDTWKKLSQFLHGTQPEFVNCQFFSAFIRKEGYLHNLPTAERFHIFPKSPMTIEDVLPSSKKWWPSWDTRKQFSCINTDTIGVSQLCDRLGRMMGTSQGLLSKEQQMDILHHCKALNLVWIGPNKLCPIEPEHLEQILGYPRHHTDVWGLELPGRLSALKYSFQTDTIGYHLSVLKNIYPDGLRLLSICSGAGGAEIALYRLGIRLKSVVSVEASESYRKILKQWWNNTGQSGELRQIAGVEKLTIRLIEGLIKDFGGFDIIIGCNPGYFASSGSSKDSLVGMDLNHFYEFTRVLHRVRSVMGRNPASAGRRA